MSVYSDLRLSYGPALYLRLDEVGEPSNGLQIPDISGNGLHGTLIYSGTDQPLGWPSPILTDTDSREFWGWQNAFVGDLTGEARISVPNNALLQPSGDFTCDGWLTPNADIPFAGNFGVFAKEGTGGVMLTWSGGSRLGGFCFDNAGTPFFVRDTSFLFNDFLEQDFYIAVVRLGDALSLYVNGTLRATTIVHSGLPTQQTSSHFYVMPSSPFYLNARFDEVAFQSNALTGSQIRALFEAGKGYMDLRGKASVLITAQINASDDPDPIGYPFRHNWSSPVIERLRWRTSKFKPTNGASEYAPQRSAPRRQVEYSHLLMNESLRRRFEARSFGGRKAYTQFEPDKVRLGTAIPAATTSLSLDFQYMDFEVDQYALFYQDDSTFEYKQLTAVSNTSISWDGDLTQAYGAHAFVKPVRITKLPSQSMNLITDTVGEASTIYDYLAEDEPLNPRRITPFSATLTYRSEEAFDLAQWQGSDYSEPLQIEFESPSIPIDDGIGVFSSKQYRWGADVISPYRMHLEGRSVIARYLGWLYARAGMNVPFWMPTFRQDLEPVTGVGTTLTVSGHDYTDLYAGADNRMDLAFVYFDNTYAMRRVNSSATSGANDALTLDSSVPTFTNLRWLCLLRRVTLSGDDVEIAWETDDVVRAAFAVIDA